MSTSALGGIGASSARGPIERDTAQAAGVEAALQPSMDPHAALFATPYSASQTSFDPTPVSTSGGGGGSDGELADLLKQRAQINQQIAQVAQE